MKLKIEVEGRLYEVDVEVEEPDYRFPSYYPPQNAHVPGSAAPAAAAAPASGGGGVEAADEAKAVRSPLAGMVARLSTEVGQAVAAGDELLVLEAMKMETAITAPTDGTVAAIHVQIRDAVKKGQLLVEFE